MGFLETGFPLFAIIMLWNVMLVGFGGVADSPFLAAQSTNGFDTVGIVNVSQTPGEIPITPTIKPTQNPDEVISFFTSAVGGAIDTLGFLTNTVFAAADSIDKSGIPSPINWVLGITIKAFMVGYLSLLFFAFVSAIKGGVVSGA